MQMVSDEMVHAILLVVLWSGVATLVALLGAIAVAIIILTGPHTRGPGDVGRMPNDMPRRHPGLRNLLPKRL